MTHESAPNPESTEERRKLTPPEKLVVALCLVGIVGALFWALDSSGIALFDVPGILNIKIGYKFMH